MPPCKNFYNTVLHYHNAGSYSFVISAWSNTTGLFAIPPADTFMQFSAIHGMSFSYIPKSAREQDNSSSFNRARTRSAHSAASFPPRYSAIFLYFPAAPL